MLIFHAVFHLVHNAETHIEVPEKQGENRNKIETKIRCLVFGSLKLFLCAHIDL